MPSRNVLAPARLVIDARPRAPGGSALLAEVDVRGRSLLAHQIEVAQRLRPAQIEVHARPEDHPGLKGLLDQETIDSSTTVVFRTGTPPLHLPILRVDRIYDPTRLDRVVRRGQDPEAAVIWRLDTPQGILGVEAELERRASYQPLGRHWAIGPARALARALAPTRVRPNAVTLLAASTMLSAATLVAWSPPVSGGASASAGVSTAAGLLPTHLLTAALLALALVLDTADGHLARLQGTSSEFGRWLDAVLDELCDMVLHAAIAYAAYRQTGAIAWLLVGMAYGMGKYLFFVTTSEAVVSSARGPHTGRAASTTHGSPQGNRSRVSTWVRWLGHADVRWHAWIVSAALGQLSWLLAAYAVYFPVRALGSAARKAVRHASS